MAAAAPTSSASGHVHRWTDAGVKDPDAGQDSRLGSHDPTLQLRLPLHLFLNRLELGHRRAHALMAEVS